MEPLPRMSTFMSDGAASERDEQTQIGMTTYSQHNVRDCQEHNGVLSRYQQANARQTMSSLSHKAAQGSSKKRRRSEDTDAKTGDPATKKSKHDYGVDGKPKGEVRLWAHEGLLWTNPATQQPEKAVYHADIRRYLLEKASQNGSKKYTYERAKTHFADDETAYLEEQRDWSPAREHWPNMRDNVLNMMERRNYSPKYVGNDIPIWREKGFVVLDQDNHPLRSFEDLPPTIASNEWGAMIEAWQRLDPRIDRKDIWARMPRDRPTGKDGTGPAVSQVGLTAIGNRCMRMRNEQGLIAWEERPESVDQIQFMKDRRPPHLRGTNSTWGAGPLSKQEMRQFRAKAKSKKGKMVKVESDNQTMLEGEEQDLYGDSNLGGNFDMDPYFDQDANFEQDADSDQEALPPPILQRRKFRRHDYSNLNIIRQQSTVHKHLAIKSSDNGSKRNGTNYVNAAGPHANQLYHGSTRHLQRSSLEVIDDSQPIDPRPSKRQAAGLHFSATGRQAQTEPTSKPPAQTASYDWFPDEPELAAWMVPMAGLEPPETNPTSSSTSKGTQEVRSFSPQPNICQQNSQRENSVQQHSLPRHPSRTPAYDHKPEVGHRINEVNLGPEQTISGHDLPAGNPNATLPCTLCRSSSGRGTTIASPTKEQSTSAPSVSPQAQSTASMSPQSGVQDHRNMVPASGRHRRAIARALDATYTDYVRHLEHAGIPHGERPRIDTSQSYAVQLRSIEDYFAVQWWSYRAGDGSPPSLRKVKEWSSGWSEWELEKQEW